MTVFCFVFFKIYIFIRDHWAWGCEPQTEWVFFMGFIDLLIYWNILNYSLYSQPYYFPGRTDFSLYVIYFLYTTFISFMLQPLLGCIVPSIGCHLYFCYSDPIFPLPGSSSKHLQGCTPHQYTRSDRGCRKVIAHLWVPGSQSLLQPSISSSFPSRLWRPQSRLASQKAPRSPKPVWSPSMLDP